MRHTTLLTHKGWFGICPVYIGDLESDAPFIDPRHWTLMPLLDLSELMFDVCFWLKEMTDPGVDQPWPIRVTGRLDEPKKKVWWEIVE